MSALSRILLAWASLFGFIFLVSYKGLPPLEIPDPAMGAAEILVPFLGWIWALVGFIFSAAFFGLGVTLAAKVARLVVEFVFDPVKFFALAKRVKIVRKEPT